MWKTEKDLTQWKRDWKVREKELHHPDSRIEWKVFEKVDSILFQLLHTRYIDNCSHVHLIHRQLFVCSARWYSFCWSRSLTRGNPGKNLQFHRHNILHFLSGSNERDRKMDFLLYYSTRFCCYIEASWKLSLQFPIWNIYLNPGFLSFPRMKGRKNRMKRRKKEKVNFQGSLNLQKPKESDPGNKQENVTLRFPLNSFSPVSQYTHVWILFRRQSSSSLPFHHFDSFPISTDIFVSNSFPLTGWGK